MAEDSVTNSDKKKTKGYQTRENILFEARKILNEEGVFLTLSELSKLIGITVGGITNYFPTKDYLFIGLADVYEQDLLKFQSSVIWKVDPVFLNLVKLFSGIMDIQYANRSVIKFISVASQSQKSLFDQVTDTWEKRQERHILIAKSLVDFDLLRSEILLPFNLKVFRFQFVNSFTTWISSYSLYDYRMDFQEIKNIYLAGILNSFEPFLTDTGRIQYNQTIDLLTSGKL